MNAYTPSIIELTVLLLIWLLASVFTSRLRRRLHRQSEAPMPASGVMLDMLAHLARPMLVLVVTQVLAMGLGSWPPASGWLESHLDHLVAWQIFWVAVGVIALIEGGAHSVYRWRAKPFPVPDLLLDIIRGALIVAVAFLVLRMEMGINIGPLLASTALLTAVVGFALQGVLGNLLAGMSLHLVRTLQPGIWVEVDGIEGKIVRTNWRETRIRTRGGYMYIIPNARVAEAKIHNYAEPTPLRRHAVNVGASYSDAPDEVMEAMMAAARAVPEVRTSPAPEAMITEFQDYGINYRMYFWTTELQRHTPIDGAVNRNIWYQFKRRGIEIPFPMSDKLLNDFMAVVYNQRRLPPMEEDVSATVDALLRSDLCAKLLADADGRPLLARPEIEQVASLVKRMLYTGGETLCTQGESGETFWVVARGRLAGTVEKGGQVAARFELEPGAVVGEMGALTGVPRSATLTTTTGTELLEFGSEAFKTLLSLHPDIPERLAELAAERSAQNSAALEELTRRQDQDSRIVLEKQGILKRLLKIMGRP